MLSRHLKDMGLQCSETSPCLFTGVLLPGQPPIYIGIYVNDIIYFSASDDVEKKFEDMLSTIGSVDFMGQVSLFLGTEFAWVHHEDGHVTVSLTQQSFIETLMESLELESCQISTFTTPYKSGHSIDSVLHDDTLSTPARDALCLQYQRPDISTAVSLLAQHQINPSPGHLESACYVAQYLANTKSLGIYFTSCHRSIVESFLHFPLPDQILVMSDAHWGPQDASVSRTSSDLPLFISRSMSAFYIDFLGPLRWASKWQRDTAASPAEAEIYATDECVKFLLDLVQILEFLQVRDLFMPTTNVIYKSCNRWVT
jgi:hypothetical protein